MSKIPFLDPAWLKAGLVDTSGDAGSSGQILSSTGSGVNWINQADITIGEADIAKTLQVTVKNVSGGELTKGTVVHASPSASPPSGNVIEVIAADYDDVAKMPAIGILKETIADEAEGEAVMMGALSGIATDGFTAGDELYVGADGALTNTKPQTAGQLIQKIAVCVKSHESNGLIKIFGAGRSNDVPLPLYIDNTNQRVGIGTNSPGVKLDVSSTGTAMARIISSDGNTARFDLLSSGNSRYSLSALASDSLLVFDEANAHTAARYYGGSSGSWIFRTNNIDRLKIDSSGNVGIGVTSLSDKLHIEDSSGANIRLVRSAFKDGNAEQFGNQISFHVGGTTSEKNFANAKIKSYDRYDGTGAFRGALAFETGNGGSHERMRIDENGNVGIGTDSPNAKLNVDNGHYLKTYSSNTTQENIIIQGAGYYIGSTLYGNVSIRSGYNNSSNAADLRFYVGTSGSNTAEKMRINSSGNLGIGTPSPDAKMVIQSASSAGAALKLSYNSGTVTTNDVLGDILFEGLDVSGGGVVGGVYGKISSIADSNWDGVSGRGALLSFSTAQFNGTSVSLTEKMRITSSGNVGIGTTSPDRQFEVYGTNDGYMKLDGGRTGNHGFTLGSDTYGFIIYDDTASAYRFVIDQDSGNVGIGTDSPESKLHLATTGGSTLTIQNTTNSGNAALHFRDEGNNDQFKVYYALAANRSYNLVNGNGLTIYSSQSSSEIARFGNASNGYTNSYFTGRVGIGTTSPGAKLDVNGDVQIKSANISNQENTDVDSAASEMVAQVAIATYTAAFFDFVIKKGTNVRSGTVYACHDGTNVEFTETSTQDLGDTSDVVLSVDISSGNMRLIATVASNDWSVKTLVKAI